MYSPKRKKGTTKLKKKKKHNTNQDIIIDVTWNVETQGTRETESCDSSLFSIEYGLPLSMDYIRLHSEQMIYQVRYSHCLDIL